MNKRDTRLGKGRIVRKKIRIIDGILIWDNNLTDEKLETYNRTTVAV